MVLVLYCNSFYVHFIIFVSKSPADTKQWGVFAALQLPGLGKIAVQKSFALELIKTAGTDPKICSINQ